MLGGWVTPANLPGYIAASIAIVALYFAIKSSLASQASAKIAQRSLERLEDEREKEQAGKFSAWVVVNTDDSGRSQVIKDNLDGRPLSLETATLFVRNASDSIITSVAFYRILNPGERDWGKPIYLGRLDAVPPGQSGPTAYDVEFWTTPAYSYRFGYLFSDSHGRSWDRSDDGQLVRISPQDKLDYILNATRRANMMNPQDLHIIRARHPGNRHSESVDPPHEKDAD